jgi:biopolymer transport protein ExbD
MAFKKRNSQSVNASSMADIAFLLLIFFLVTTKIDVDKGVYVRLPPKVDDVPVEVRERNIYNVLLNSNDKLLVEEEPMSYEAVHDGKLRKGVRKFISNEGFDPSLSETSKKAVISIKVDRGTSYEMYINILDEIKKAYAEERAKYLNVSYEEFIEIEKVRKEKNAKNEKLYQKARMKYPVQISDAEPTRF